jgi:hypothetical protein
MQMKGEEILQVGFQNVANLPESMRTAKSRQTVSYIVKKQYDVFMMSEIGLCWKHLGIEDQWFERIFGKFKATRSCLAYNKTEIAITKKLQPGGVGVLAADDVVHRIIEQGRDESGLGRWAWLLLQGRRGVKIRVISVYRPCDSNGPESVNQQHQRFLTKKRRLEEPREALYVDLYDEVSAWIEAGDQIIIGIDANEDVRTGRTDEFFRAFGMKEAILTRHQERSPPATNNRNNSREPIDGLWVTPGLKAVAAGYEAFGEGCPSDHRALWADFTYEDAFGHSPPPLIAPTARRLRAADPRLTDRYNSRVKAALLKADLPQRLFKVEENARKSGWTDQHQEEYNKIQNEQKKLRQEIEQTICKLRSGEVPWSPKLQHFRTAIELWTMILQ